MPSSASAYVSRRYISYTLLTSLSLQLLRPRWTSLYHARKKQSDAASRLPDLPKSLFGWIPVIYRISQEEVLASAGLDAFAFLAFFRYATKYLSVTLFFSLTIILPVNYRYTGQVSPLVPPRNSTDGSDPEFYNLFTGNETHPRKPKLEKDDSYLWMYVVFVYFFTGLAVYLLVAETQNLIRIRQAYLGTQSTITDRTIRLSGIPTAMRSEDAITNFVEALQIGQVDSIMLCRNWKALDDLMAKRMQCLRKLEKAWASYLGHHHSLQHNRSNQRRQEHIEDGEEADALLSRSEMEQAHTTLRIDPVLP